jgi:CheY-like chemotaxis protein
MPRILLVEDNEMNRDMLTRRLSRRGYEVLHAANGIEAVDAAVRCRPDLVLMDLSLPDVDGLEATRQIKSNPDAHVIPVIALTAHAMLNDRERALAAGCDDYDTKPIDLTRLLDKIQVLLPGAAR